jgi:hypothetical protein
VEETKVIAEGTRENEVIVFETWINDLDVK